MNEITDKNWVLVARGNIKIYVNEAEFQGIKRAIEAGSDWLEVQGRLIMKQAILYLLSASDFKTAEDDRNAMRRGMWKCEHGWVAREFKECSKGCIK